MFKFKFTANVNHKGYNRRVKTLERMKREIVAPDLASAITQATEMVHDAYCTSQEYQASCGIHRSESGKVVEGDNFKVSGTHDEIRDLKKQIRLALEGYNLQQADEILRDRFTQDEMIRMRLRDADYAKAKKLGLLP